MKYHLESRAHYFQYIAEQAKNFGIVPFIWDNGSDNNMDNGLFNRYDGTIIDNQALKAYLIGFSAGNYPY